MPRPGAGPDCSATAGRVGSVAGGPAGSRQRPRGHMLVSKMKVGPDKDPSP